MGDGLKFMLIFEMLKCDLYAFHEDLFGFSLWYRRPSYANCTLIYAETHKT